VIIRGYPGETMMNNTEKHGNRRKAMEIFTKGGRLAFRNAAVFS